jgi:hypothetical protein
VDDGEGVTANHMATSVKADYTELIGAIPSVMSIFGEENVRYRARYSN